MNEGNHYEPVVCVMRPDSSGCYGFCGHTYNRGDEERCSHCQLTQWRQDYNSEQYRDRNYDMEPNTEYNDWASEVEYEEQPELHCDTEEHEPETCGGWAPIKDAEQLDRSTFERDGYNLQNDPDKHMERERDNRRRHMETRNRRERKRFLRALEKDSDSMIQGWLCIMRSWETFLEWLQDRWWGVATTKEIADFLNAHGGQHALIVSEPYNPGQFGALCSITWKEEQDKIDTGVTPWRKGCTCAPS